MEADLVTISSIAERQAPALMRTEALVYNLRLCTFYATTREAARIRLQGSTFNRFASSLTVLANDGLDALVDVNECLNDIRYTTHAIAEPNGTLEGLVVNFGKPERARTFDRKLSKLQEEVNSCSGACSKLDERLGVWRNQIAQLKRDIQANMGDEQLRADKLADEIGQRERDISVAKHELEYYKRLEGYAQEKHKETIAHTKPLVLAEHAPNSWTIMAMMYSVASVGYSWWTSQAAATTVKQTQQEVDRRRTAAVEYEQKLQQANMSLKSLEKKHDKLDGFMKALEKTLRGLELITNDVRAVGADFNEMRVQVKKLTQGQTSDLGRIVEDSLDGGLQEGEIEDFTSSARKMQRLALMVEHLSWLYASIIKEVLMIGLSSQHAEMSTSGVIKDYNEVLSSGDVSALLRLENGNASTSTIVTQIDESYRDCHLRLQRSNSLTSDTSRSPTILSKTTKATGNGDKGSRRSLQRFFSGRKP